MLSNTRKIHTKKPNFTTWLLALSAILLLGVAIWLGTPSAASFLVSLFRSQELVTDNVEQPEVLPQPLTLVPNPPTGQPEVLPDPELSPLLKPLIEALIPKTTNQSDQETVDTSSVQTAQQEFYLDFILPQMDGSITHTKVNRKISTGPDAKKNLLLALLNGPTAEELSQNLMSLIPSETRLISIDQTGDTLTINLSEDFQYNSLGTEGYKAQVIQIIQTMRQFPDVKKVQFLIEGRRVSALGEAMPLGNPLPVDRFQ